MENGLPGNTIYKIFQDSKKYIWFATNNGACRYNGSTFLYLNTKDGLPDNEILDVQEDRYGKIWFLPLSGFPVYYVNGEIKSPKIPVKVDRKPGLSMVLDSLGTLYLGAHGGIYEVIRDSFVYFNIWPQTYAGTPVLSHVLPSGKVFINKDQFVLLDIHSIKEAVIVEKKTLPCNIGFLINHKSFEVFNKTYSIDEHGLSTRDEFRHTFLCSIAKALENLNVYFIKEDQNAYWVGTNKGLYKFITDSSFGQKPTIYFPQLPIFWMEKDFEGSMWLASAGAAFFVPSFDIIHYAETMNFSERGLNKLTLTSNGLVFSSENGVLGSFSHDTYSVLYKSSFLKDKKIISIVADSKGGFWVGTDDGNLIFIKGRAEKLFPGLGAVKEVKEFDPGHIIWGTPHSIFQIDKKSLQVKDIAKEAGIYPVRVYCMLVSLKKEIWTGTDKGVYRLWYSTDSGKFVPCKISEEKVVSMAYLKDSTVVMGTKTKGLLLNCNSHFNTITEKNGLQGNLCRRIVVENNEIWALTDVALNRISIDKENNVVKTQQMDKNRFIPASFIKDFTVTGDSIWLATFKGLILIKGNYFKVPSVKPVIHITSMFVNSNKRELEKGLVFAYNENNIRINFEGVSYQSGGKVMFKYRLTGLDSTWTFTPYGQAKFTSLPAGYYTFCVNARNSAGVWGTPRFFSFTIKKAFWQSLVFKVLVWLLSLVAISFVIYQRISRRKSKELEKAVLKRKVAESELMALRSQMNPHFIFNSMNSILALIDDNNPEAAQTYLSKLSLLMRNILQSSRKKNISLKEELEMLNLYVELEMLRFKNKFDYKIEIIGELDPEDEQIPGMILQPYVENAIWHGLLHKEGRGQLLICIGKQEDSLLCIIEDNGIGISRSQEMKKNKHSDHTSLGLKMIDERLALISLDYGATYKAEISQLSDDTGTPCGTRVSITLPLI